MSSYLLAPPAYLKIFFHAAKHPHQPVNGVLLGKQSASGIVTIEDAVPLLHHWTSLSPMMEIGLDLVSRFHPLNPFQSKTYSSNKGRGARGFYRSEARGLLPSKRPIGGLGAGPRRRESRRKDQSRVQRCRGVCRSSASRSRSSPVNDFLKDRRRKIRDGRSRTHRAFLIFAASSDVMDSLSPQSSRTFRPHLHRRGDRMPRVQHLSRRIRDSNSLLMIYLDGPL